MEQRVALSVGDAAPVHEAKPVFGLPVRIPAEGRPTAVVFVSGLGSPVARRTLLDLQERFAELDAAGTAVVAVAPGPLARARDFVPRHHLLYPLVVDEDGALRRAWRVGEDRTGACTLKGLHRVDWRRALGALRCGLPRREGPLRQLGAEFLVDDRGRIAYARYACSLLEVPDLRPLSSPPSS